MKRSRFSEEQIIGILKEHEAGVSVVDLCRKHGVSDASIYKWKAKFGGERGSASLPDSSRSSARQPHRYKRHRRAHNGSKRRNFQNRRHFGR